MDAEFDALWPPPVNPGGNRQRSTLRVLAPAVFGVATTATLAISYQLHHEASSATTTYGDQVAALQQALRRSSAGFLFLAGDSHAAILAREVPAGIVAVNGSVNGVRAPDYARLAAALVPASRASTVILSLGSNHLRLTKRPSDAGRLAAFRRSVDETLASFSAWTDQLIVLAIPPIGEQLRDLYDHAAVLSYSDALAAACAARPPCRYVDPYRSMRAASFGLARAGTFNDGLHADDSGPLWAILREGSEAR